MLRALVLALLIANLGYYSWTQGWLDDIVGVRSESQREPERLARQVRPELVRLLLAGETAPPGALPSPAASTPNGAASAASAPGSAASHANGALACLEAGPYSAAEFGAAASAVQAALPAGSWADVKADKPGNYILYMGRYADREMFAKKKEEIGRIKLAFEEVRNSPGLEPGLNLGRFDDRAAADKALATIALRGVHSARVVEITPSTPMHLLRLEGAAQELVAQATGLKSDALKAGFVPCTKAP